MKAKIVDIEAKQTTIKLDSGKFITVPNSRLNFSYKLGDTITIEKDGSKIYFLPRQNFLDDDEEEYESEKAKKRLSPAGKFFAFVCIVGGLALLIAPIISIYLRKQEESAKQALTDCLASAAAYSESQSAEFSAYIDCYNAHPHPEQYSEEIADFESKRDAANQSACIDQAEKNYAISQEEIDAAGSDLSSQIVLLKRLGSRFEKIKICYETYKSGDYQASINEIDAKIAENNSYVTEAQSLQNSYRQNSSRSFNCFTTGYGSWASTSCY